MNKLTGEFEIGDRVTIHKWYYNEYLKPLNRLKFPIIGTVKGIRINIPTPYGIKVDGIPEEEHKGTDNLWWFKEEEITLIDNNPFTTKSFFTCKNTTPPKTKEIPNYKIINLEHGRKALVTKEEIYFFLSATAESAIKESFEEHGEDIPEYLECYISNYEDLENLFNSLNNITVYINDFEVYIPTFKIGCQEFKFGELKYVLDIMNSL